MNLASVTRLAEQHQEMSTQAQDAIRQLARLATPLADEHVRVELRRFLDECAAARVDSADLEQARVVLAAFDGHLCEPGAPDEGVVVIGAGRR